MHQPRSSIWALFDHLLVLSEGRTLYHGPAADAPGHFAAAGYACPPGYNPADLILDVTRCGCVGGWGGGGGGLGLRPAAALQAAGWCACPGAGTLHVAHYGMHCACPTRSNGDHEQILGPPATVCTCLCLPVPAVSCVRLPVFFASRVTVGTIAHPRARQRRRGGCSCLQTSTHCGPPR